MAVSVIGYILGKIAMSNSSSDKASESKRPRPRTDRSHDDASKSDEPSAYYYDDATGYEIYEDKDDEKENED